MESKNINIENDSSNYIDIQSNNHQHKDDKNSHEFDKDNLMRKKKSETKAGTETTTTRMKCEQSLQYRIEMDEITMTIETERDVNDKDYSGNWSKQSEIDVRMTFVCFDQSTSVNISWLYQMNFSDIK